MKQFLITQEHVDQALIKAAQVEKEAGSQHRAESITDGTSYLLAFVGEIIITEAIGGENISSEIGTSKFNFDLYYKNWTFDVKLKLRNVDPRPFHDASVAQTSLHQKCHGYIFLNVHNPNIKVFNRQNSSHYLGAILTFCGFQGKKTYLENSVFYEEGHEFDNIKPDGEPFKCLRDMYNRPYSSLKSYEELLHIPERIIK